MTMAFLSAAGDEDSLIDSYRPQTDMQSRLITQADKPGEDPQNITEPNRVGLPDPSVGGRGATGSRLGFSVGFFNRRQRFRNFDGATAKGNPTKAEPVQGQVGNQNNHGARLWAGVRTQLVDSSPSFAQYSGTYVGNLNLKPGAGGTDKPNE